MLLEVIDAHSSDRNFITCLYKANNGLLKIDEFFLHALTSTCTFPNDLNQCAFENLSLLYSAKVRFVIDG